MYFRDLRFSKRFIKRAKSSNMLADSWNWGGQASHWWAPCPGHKGAAGNVTTEDIVFMCDEMGVETGVNLEALIECARLAEDIVGHDLPGKVMRGGALSVLRRDAKAQASRA